MVLVCIPSSASPLIAFREGEEELQKGLSFETTRRPLDEGRAGLVWTSHSGNGRR